MFQATFFVISQMFFEKPNMIFFQKPPKTLNICLFPSTIRYFWFKYLLNFWGKYWHESTLQRNSENHKTKILFKTEKQNYNLNYLEQFSF